MGSGTNFEWRLRPIALQYLKGWFSIDVVSLLPSLVDILPFVPGSGLGKSDDPEDADDARDVVRMLRIFRAMRLIKLVRLARSMRLLARWRSRISIRYSSIMAIQLCVVMTVGTHWIACLLKLQATFAERQVGTWLGAYGWCVEVGDEGDEECVHFMRIYVACLHWAFGILTGAVPFPMHCKRDDDQEGFTDDEMLINLLLLGTGALGWTYVTAKILARASHPDLLFPRPPPATSTPSPRPRPPPASCRTSSSTPTPTSPPSKTGWTT